MSGRHLASGDIGVIAPGARADLLLTEQDPTVDLAALRDWRVVFADGRRYERAMVDELLPGCQEHFRAGAYDAVMGTVAGWAVERFEHTSNGDRGTRRSCLATASGTQIPVDPRLAALVECSSMACGAAWQGRRPRTCEDPEE